MENGVAVKTFSSKFINLKHVENARTLALDYELYNSMLREALSLIELRERPKKTKKGAPQEKEEKKRPGGGKRLDGAPSVHTQLKDKYLVSDYFVTSVESGAKGIKKSNQAALDRCIEKQESIVAQLEERIKFLAQKIANLEKDKKSLIERSKARKEGGRVPVFHSYRGSPTYAKDIQEGDQVRTEFTVEHFFAKKKPGYKPKVFANDYLYELLYVDPKLHKLRQQKGQIQGRLNAARGHLEALKRKKEEKQYATSLVSWKKLHQWRDLSDAERDKLFKENRMQQMVLAGRHDAKQGNWMVKYDTNTRTLTYRPAKGSDAVTIPNVVFPYGQELIDAAVNAGKADQQAVAWCISFKERAIQVRCVVHMPETKLITASKQYGVIGIDMNYNNISISETNEHGQLLRHRMLKFDPSHKSSEQMEHIISEKLEKVFQQCVETGKPLVCENIKAIKQKTLYQNKKKNRHASMFAHRLMSELIQSKSMKYGVEVILVNPAYTSIIGRLKYMELLGLTVHEAASFVIARRGQGFKEPLTKAWQQRIPENLRGRGYNTQWAAANKASKAAA